MTLTILENKIHSKSEQIFFIKVRNLINFFHFVLRSAHKGHICLFIKLDRILLVNYDYIVLDTTFLCTGQNQGQGHH